MQNREEDAISRNRFSASYGGTCENFIINCAVGKRYDLTENQRSILCVVQNILQRGKPTRASEYLKQMLGDLQGEPVNLLNNEQNSWQCIKGANDTGYNPAREFYEKVFPNRIRALLGEDYLFVSNLLLPEADFADLLTHNRQFDGQQVDFYFPQIKFVLEIDGAGHNDPIQKQKDIARDRALKEEGYSVKRIKTTDVANDRCNVCAFLINSKIKDSDWLQSYKQAIAVPVNDIRIKYDAVMRLQLMLLLLMQSAKLNLDKPITVYLSNSDVPELWHLLEIAYEDLKLWISHIAELAKERFLLPRLECVDKPGKATINLDFSMFKRYTDTDGWEQKKNAVYIRTAYIKHNNYYTVACAKPINYKIILDESGQDIASLRFLLRNLFALEDFREGQLGIIQNCLAHKDTIGILPTGTGKSLCYQLAALLQPGISLVTVPIVSLMLDQRNGLNKNGFHRVAYINSMITGADKGEVLNTYINGKCQMLFIAPERTQNNEFIYSLQEVNRKFNFAYAVIDEAHCLSEWGHDFRVSYLRLIPILRQYCTDICLIGLTATASQAVLDDLKAEFDNDGSGVKAVPSMDRQELVFKRIAVASPAERKEAVLKIAADNDGIYTDVNGKKKNSVGLVFCQKVNSGIYHSNLSCMEVSSFIQTSDKFKNRTLLYHGQLTPKEKISVQNKFMAESFSGIMVCTNAFGMGIDKENVRYTIHASIPKSIEAFYQEAGRAGRDADKSVKSYCYLLHQRADEIDPGMVNKIFNIDTGVRERKELCRKLQGDLSTVMYFWNVGRQTVADECSSIASIRSNLHTNNPVTFSFDKTSRNQLEHLDVIQNALYKLSILEIVDGWTVEFIKGLNEGLLQVSYTDADAAKIEQALLKYIHKHDIEFTLSEGVSKYQQYNAILRESNDVIQNYIKILIVWRNNNILYSRLQSIYNMYQLCAPDISDAEFRKRINDYFRYTDDNVLFEAIIQNPLAYRNWYLLLQPDKHTVKQTRARVLLGTLSRYLESYSNNTGLNYLSGILRMLCNDYIGTEGEWRLSSSIANVAEVMDARAQKEIVTTTLAIGKNFDIDCRNELSRILLESFPDITSKVYEALEDNYSLAVLVRGATGRVKKVLGDKEKWII